MQNILIITITALITFLLVKTLPKETIKENTQVIKIEEKLPFYILNEYKKYSIIGEDENSWKSFLDILKDKNKTVLLDKLPYYINHDIKVAGFDTKLLDEKMWKEYTLYLKNQDKLKDYKDNKELFKEAKKGKINLDIIKKLIEDGYNINLLNENEENYAQILVENLNDINDVSKVKYLINNLGVNIDSKNKHNEDILNYAIRNKNIKIRDELISFLDEKGLSLVDNPERYRFIMYQKENDKYRNIILDNINLQNTKLGHENFNSIAATLNDEEITKIFNNGYKINKEDDFLLTAIAANDKISTKITKKIILSGIDLNKVSYETPLQYFILFKQEPKIVEFLLQNGANPYIKNVKGENAFDTANKSIYPKNSKIILDVLDKYKHKFKKN